MRKHTMIGERILGAAPSAERRRAAGSREPRARGRRGYPDGLAGDEIPLGARIIAVCDAYDAMLSSRAYRRTPMSKEGALAELHRCSGSPVRPAGGTGLRHRPRCVRHRPGSDYEYLITLRMPSWASISSKPRLTSSSVSWCEMNGSTSISPVEVALHELRHLVAALDAAERRAAHPPAGDQEARHDVERLALAGHAGDRAQAPAHPRRLDGLAHDGDDAGRLERVVGAEAAGHLEDASTVSSPPTSVSVAPWPARQLQPVLGQVDAHDPLGALEPAAGDRAEADHAGAEHDAGRARLDLGRVHRRAEPGREPAGEQAGAVERRLGRHLGQRDLRHHGVLGEGGGAHEVADLLAVARSRVVPSGR